MGLEVAEFVQDFVDTNPISGDDINQGDNHIRLIKETLKRTFPSASKAMYASVAEQKTTSYTVVAADENKTIYLDCTSGSVTITLPALTAGAAGFNVRFIKADLTTTPAFIVVAGAAAFYSGPMSVVKARRCIPGSPFNAVWSGGSWFVERCEKAPIGTAHPFAGATLPVGYEWPNGQTLASFATNYPEYTLVVQGGGVTPDMRGRSPFGKSNMGGSDNGILSLVPGTTLWGTHGTQTVTLVQANLGSAWYFSTDSFTFSGSGSGLLVTYGALATGYNLSHGHGGRITGSFSALYGFGAGTGLTNSSTTELNAIDASGTLDHAHYFSFTPAGGINHGYARANGSDTAVNKLPPLIIMNFILVVE